MMKSGGLGLAAAVASAGGDAAVPGLVMPSGCFAQLKFILQLIWLIARSHGMFTLAGNA